MTPHDPAALPLDQLSVLELGDDLAVRYAGLILASLGAVVTRIETPDLADAGPCDREAERLAMDRGKRSAVLDLHSDAGRAAAVRVALRHDAVLTGPTDVADMLAQALPSDAPGPTLCVISGRPADTQDVPELILQAMTGVADLTGAEDGPPAGCGVPVCAILAGLYAVVAVLAVTCRGPGAAARTITVAKTDAALAIMAYLGLTYLVNGDVPHRTGTGHPSVVPYGAFQTAAGEVVAAPFTQRFWRRFCGALGRPDLIDDERFATLEARARHRLALVEEIEGQMRTSPADAWLSVLLDNDVPCGPVLTVPEASALTDSLHRGLVHDVEARTDDGGSAVRLRLPSMPFLFHLPGSGLLAASNLRPPPRGAHTAELPGRPE